MFQSLKLQMIMEVQIKIAMIGCSWSHQDGNRNVELLDQQASKDFLNNNNGFVSIIKCNKNISSKCSNNSNLIIKERHSLDCQLQLHPHHPLQLHQSRLCQTQIHPGNIHIHNLSLVAMATVTTQTRQITVFTTTRTICSPSLAFFILHKIYDLHFTHLFHRCIIVHNVHP